VGAFPSDGGANFRVGNAGAITIPKSTGVYFLVLPDTSQAFRIQFLRRFDSHTLPPNKLRGSPSMARRKPKQMDAANEARRRARDTAGRPPASRIIDDKRKRTPKHRKSYLEAELSNAN